MSLMSDIGTAIKNKFMINDFTSQSSNLLTGGGTISVSSTWEVKWSQRFITISNGMGAIAIGGYFDITMPAAATVITGVGGAANKTVTANGIPLTTWETLYYILPIGGAEASLPANFRVVANTADVTIPGSWVKICTRNNDGSYIDFACGVSLRNNTSINTNLYDVKGADVDGAVSSANTLATARTIQTNLASTSSASFNGSANVTPGVTGTLPVANGGTGVTTSTGTGSNVLSASPALTGTPTAPTASSGVSTTQLATTQFVNTTNIGNGTTTFNGFGGSGFKNYLINGNFKIWQRGINFTTFGYTADRWILNNGGTTGTPAVFLGTNPTTKENMLGFSASNLNITGYVDIIQHIEDMTQFKNGEIFTVSYRYASSVPTANMNVIVQFMYDDGVPTGWTSTGQSIPISANVTTGSFTFQSPFDSTKTRGAMSRVSIIFRMSGSAANGKAIDLYNVQVEKGSVATSFEDRPIGLELSLCQRYYEEYYYLLTGFGDNTGGFRSNYLPLKVKKRVAPTTTVIDYAGTAGKMSGRNNTGSFFNGLTPNFTVTSDTILFDSNNQITYNGYYAFLKIDAEIY